MSTHRFLSASSGSRWSRCPLSASMAAIYPDEAGLPAQEGTACHHVSDRMFDNQPVAVGDVAPNGIIVTREMIEAAAMYVKIVHQVTDDPQIEKTLDCKTIHPDQCGGTPDAWWFDTVSRRLYLWDLKFGFGFVEVYKNHQLMIYAAAVLEFLGLTDDESVTVEFCIVQPRCYDADGPVRRWTAGVPELRNEWALISEAAALATSTAPPSMAGSHCRYCPGRANCDTLRNASTDAAEFARVSTPKVMTAEGASFELSMLTAAADAINARIAGVTAWAESQVKNGVEIPGYELREKQTRIRWNDGVTAEQLESINPALVEKKPVTPAQAKKVVDKSVISALSFKPSGAMTLAKTDSSRLARIISNHQN